MKCPECKRDIMGRECSTCDSVSSVWEGQKFIECPECGRYPMGVPCEQCNFEASLPISERFTPPPSPWHPIETAPKNRPILLAFHHDWLNGGCKEAPVVAYWSQADECWKEWRELTLLYYKPTWWADIQQVPTAPYFGEP